ncbi:hypothetical protein ANAEL_00373 [Anaerolineales bacterium]|nr:hypothetical protein ANAEL_00373 [Anaerolineales bacterium]
MPEHELGVLAARQVVDEFAAKLNAKVVKREQNMGLARSVVSGVTDLCERYGRVIVLEDDFILHPFFLDFMLQSLDRYENDDQVAQVAGYLPPIYPKIETDSFFLPLTTSCGWATWQRAWKLFSWEIDSALQILDTDLQMRFHFDLDGAYHFSDMLRLATDSKVDSWGIRWRWRTFYHRKLTLYPRRSLVWVGGFDNLATHTKSEEVPKFYDQPLALILENNWKGSVSFPGTVQTDEIVFNRLKKLLRHKPPRVLLRSVIHILIRWAKYFKHLIRNSFIR